MTVLAIVAILTIAGAVIGFTSKWVAVKLMFHPAEFVGIGPIGWQGIIQRRSPKFAAGVADMVTDMTPFADIVQRIDPHEVADVAAPALSVVVDRLAPSLIEGLQPGFWSETSPEVRAMIIEGLGPQVRAAVVEIVQRAIPIAVSGIDDKTMIIELLSGENADRFALLMSRIASKELRALINYGAVVGCFVGLLEAVVYLIFERWWLLPIVGALDGLVNNYLGLQMIFRPLERRRYLGVFPYQGLFPSRQAEVAHEYAGVMGTEILTPTAALLRIANSNVRDDLMMIVRSVVEQSVGCQLELVAPTVGVEVTGELIEQTVEDIMATVTAGMDPDLIDFEPILGYLDECFDVSNTLETQLTRMTKAEFESILRGIFSEDEPILLAIGTCIGAAVGMLQAAIVLGLHLR